MDHFQLAIVVMAVTGTPWERRDAEGQRRQLTAEELDTLADFDWPWAEVKRSIAAWATAVRSSLRPRASNRLDPVPTPR